MDDLEKLFEEVAKLARVVADTPGTAFSERAYILMKFLLAQHEHTRRERERDEEV